MFNEIHNNDTRSRDNMYIYWEIVEKLIMYVNFRGLEELNSLPAEVRNALSLTQFKSEVRKYLERESWSFLLWNIIWFWEIIYGEILFFIIVYSIGELLYYLQCKFVILCSIKIVIYMYESTFKSKKINNTNQVEV